LRHVSALPVFNAEPPERADAARNRRLVLDAAARLFEENPGCVTMEAVAAEAGVGKGTVFRRFGDRAGLVRALISDTEIELQEGLIRGAPPLGPGAPARDRLIAFGAAYLQFLERHGRLLATAGGAIWLTTEPYALYRTHVALLLEQAGCGDSAQYLADVLMAPLAAPAFLYQRDLRERSLAELTAAYEDLVARLID
jgi:AcrR family transcriptional regulator